MASSFLGLVMCYVVTKIPLKHSFICQVFVKKIHLLELV